MIRRLPVYLLVDCSESMIGTTIETVEQAIGQLLRELRSDPHALETVYVSIITFSGDAKQLMPLTEVTDVQPPKLEVRPGTSLGKALRLLKDSINRDVRKTTHDTKGDYRPLVFLMTDGQPTDDWTSVKDAMFQLTNPRIGNFYAIGFGNDLDYENLREISDIAFRMEDLSPDAIKKLFVWLTASVRSASVGATGGKESQAGAIDLDKKPTEVIEVTEGSAPAYDGVPRQVFLKAYCTTLKRPYLMRFRLFPGTQMYEAVQSHPLETTLEQAASFKIPPINASQLMGCPPCPFCQNPVAGVCGCEALICVPDTPVVQVMCPKCLQNITLGQGGGDFTISQSAG